MLELLRRLFQRSDRVSVPRVRRKVVRLSYANPPENRNEVLEVEEKKEREITDNIEKAIEHMIEAARHVACSYCRGRIIDEIDFLLRFYYKTKLVESGVDPKEVDKVFEERYASLVKKRVEKIRKELKVGDKAYMVAVKDKAAEVLSQS